MGRGGTARSSVSAAIADAIQAVHATALAPHEWSDAIARVSDLLPENAGGMVIVRPAPGRPETYHHEMWNPPEGLGERLAAIMVEGWTEPYTEAILAGSIRAPFAYTGTISLDGRQMRDTGIFFDVYPGFGIRDTMGVSVGGPDGAVIAFFSDRLDEPTGAAAKDLLGRLGAHLDGATRARRRLMAAEGEAIAHLAVADQLATGIVWLARDGRVLDANRSARDRLDRRQGVCLSQGRIASPNGDQILSFVVSEALAGRSAGPMPLAALPGGAACLAVALPVPQRLRCSDAAAAMLFLVEPGFANVSGLLRRVHGLTPAEAAIAQGIVDGRDLDAIAAERRVSVATARTQLKSALSKMGVRRQAELVGVVAGLAALRTARER